MINGLRSDLRHLRRSLRPTIGLVAVRPVLAVTPLEILRNSMNSCEEL